MNADDWRTVPTTPPSNGGDLAHGRSRNEKRDLSVLAVLSEGMIDSADGTIQPVPGVEANQGVVWEFSCNPGDNGSGFIQTAIPSRYRAFRDFDVSIVLLAKQT